MVEVPPGSSSNDGEDPVTEDPVAQDLVAQDLVDDERYVRAQIGGDDLDFESMAAVSNIFRVANAARYHLERVVLARQNLSFTAFTVLWVLWVWGEMESRHLATKAGISKGTLTGVVRTLERRGLVTRRSHVTDRRLVLVAASTDGVTTMKDLFPEFNREETRITADLSSSEVSELAHHLRSMLRTIEALEDPYSTGS